MTREEKGKAKERKEEEVEERIDDGKQQLCFAAGNEVKVGLPLLRVSSPMLAQV